jgi:hypothetical protein
MTARTDCARFTGVVRMENNGGFASVRASFGSGIDLSQFKGLYLDVKPGDAVGLYKLIHILKAPGFNPRYCRHRCNKKASGSAHEGATGCSVPVINSNEPEV